MKVIDSKAADRLLVAKAALAATVGRTAVRMLTDARVRHLNDEPLLPVLEGRLDDPRIAVGPVIAATGD
jgi:hypothetical protein